MRHVRVLAVSLVVAGCGLIPPAPTPNPAVAAVPCRVFVDLPSDQQVDLARALLPDDPAFWERVRTAQHRPPGTRREELLRDVAGSLDKGCRLEPDRWTLPTLVTALYD